MELGNIIFENSRGEFEVPRKEFEDIFFPLLKKIGLDNHGYSEMVGMRISFIKNMR